MFLKVLNSMDILSHIVKKNIEKKMLSDFLLIIF